MVTEGYSGPFFSSNSGGYGDGGCGISTLLIFALLAGGGFGGWGGRNEGYNCAETSHIDHQFNQIQEDIQTSELMTQSMIENLGVSQYQQAIFKEICDTNRNVDDKFCSTQALIADAKYDNALIAKDAEITALRCCCETKEAIAASTNAIMQKMDANEIQCLRDKLNDVQLGLSQCKQNEVLLSAINPVSKPAFITYAPNQAVFPPYNAAPFNYGGFNGGCCA